MKQPNTSRVAPAKRKKQAPSGDEPKLMPIINRTAQDAGTGLIIGLDADAPERSGSCGTSNRV